MVNAIVAFAIDEEAAASKRMELYVFFNIQETSQQSYKTQIRILPGLAQLSSGQPGPGATLLGWPKSIYHDNWLP